MAQTITVKCPQCEQIYINWHVPAVGESAKSDSGSAYQPSTACSKCGHRSVLSELEDVNGTFQLPSSQG
ncbi:MAG: hypothetical protein AAFN12_02950 [Cyanobacteria bacterium J06560_2]